MSKHSDLYVTRVLCSQLSACRLSSLQMLVKDSNWALYLSYHACASLPVTKDALHLVLYTCQSLHSC